MNNIEKVIENLPKAELHLHIEGSLEPELMFKLAKRNNIEIPFQTIDEIKKAYQFDNLQSFLDIYYQGAAVLIHEQDFFDMTYEYLERAHHDKVLHTEIFFDPQTHTERGINFKTVIDGISKALKQGEKDFGITSNLIMCFLRHLSEEEAFKTLEEALPFKDQIIAVGLDSSELGHPPQKFQNVFKKALEQGFLTVAHAGEEGPTEYIWEAINLLKVSRIDHGVRCLEDQKLVEYLKEKQICLTVCPQSNIKLCVFKEMKDHNFKKLLNEGLNVTINSDDPAYFDGYMNQNYLLTAKALDLSVDELKLVAKNSFNSSFISDELKNKYCQLVEAIN